MSVRKRPRAGDGPLYPAMMPLSGARGFTGVFYSGLSRKVLMQYHDEGRLRLNKRSRRRFVMKTDLDELLASINDE
jgi:hypothetical protein